MTPDEEIAPAASRPAPVEEVQPLGRDEAAHVAAAYELVLNATWCRSWGCPADTPFSFRDAECRAVEVARLSMEERSVGQGIDRGNS